MNLSIKFVFQYLVMVCLLSGCVSQIENVLPPKHRMHFNTTRKLPDIPAIGASMEDCMTMIQLPMIDASTFRDYWPYKERLAFIPDSSPLLCWVFNEETPWYFIGIFDHASPPRLIEFFSLAQGTHLVPMRNGNYTKQMSEITQGTNVEDIFRKLGKISPSDYRLLSNGCWVINYTYYSVGSKIITYIIDAATGIVVAVCESNI